MHSFNEFDAPFLELLNLSGVHSANQATTLDPLFFALDAMPMLKVLDLSWTQINAVSVYFEAFEQLKVLNLTGININGNLSLTCLSTVLSLKHLETFGINTWNIDTDTHLQDPPYLYELSVRCDLNAFNQTCGCWSISPSLKTLQLRGITFDHRVFETFCVEGSNLISGSSFEKRSSRLHGFNTLKVFDMSTLDLKLVEGPVITVDTFSDMTNLEVLLIRRCRLYLFSQSQLRTFFSHNRLLKIIDMSNNSLTSLPVDMFAKNKHLQYINLSRNNLEHFNTHLGHLHNLTQLDLRSNKLKNIHNNVIDSIQNISRNRTLTIYLQNNALQCSCNLVNVVPIVSNQSVIECEINGRIYLIGNYSETGLPSELYELCHPQTTGLSIVSIFGIAIGSVVLY